jgi:hypothetical protein
LLAVVISGCGAGPAGRPAAQPSISVTPTSASAAPVPNTPDPNAPEVNAAGDIPDNQVFVPVTPPGAAFTVSVPEGWARTDTGTTTVFSDKYNSVRIESRPRATAPDEATVRSQEVPQLQSSQPGFRLDGVTSVQRKAGPAVLVTYLDTSTPNPVTAKSVTEAVERYTFWRNGTEAVLTLAGPQGSDNVDPWRIVTDSFRWQR